VTVHIALLRAINVGGHAKIAMSDLHNMFAALGFSDTPTLLQSGNVVFHAGVGRSVASSKHCWSARPLIASGFEPTSISAPRRSGQESSRPIPF
jgi:hypothetical protein